jgi:hypothetical protein
MIWHIKSWRLGWAGHWGVEKSEQGSGGKVHGKQSDRKSEAELGSWYQNGYYGDWLGDLEWIQLATYRDWWRSVVNMVINLRMLAPRS